VDERTTPIEDATVDWAGPDASPEIVAELVIPQQDLTGSSAREEASMVDAMQFNPWNWAGGIRPIGGLNRARKPVYQASAQFRSQGRIADAGPS
jgi:hypothetical protein